jgi:opacity protein-like surface antigen
LVTGTSGYSSSYGSTKPKDSYSEDIDSQVSLLLKASYPISESFKLYGLAGYTKTKIEINGLGQTNDSKGNIIGDYHFEHTISEGGFSYGLGLNYQINEQFSFFADYQVLADYAPNRDFSENWDSTTVGINYYF